MRSVIASAFLVVAFASPSWADGPPRYDAMATCEKQAATIGQQGNATLVRSCLAQEQWNYDALKAAWPSIPAGARTSRAASPSRRCRWSRRSP